MDNDVTLALVKVGLEVESLKHKAAAMNIAGHGNPDFSPQKVSFDVVLEKQLTDSMKAGAGEVNVELKAQFSDRSPDETVDLDAEVMNALNAEQRYKALVQMANKRLGLMKLAIKGNQ